MGIWAHGPHFVPDYLNALIIDWLQSPVTKYFFFYNPVNGSNYPCLK